MSEHVRLDIRAVPIEGRHIIDYVSEVCQIAKKLGTEITLFRDGVEIIVSPRDYPSEVVRRHQEDLAYEELAQI